MADKTVNVKVATKEDLSGVEAIENHIKQLQHQKLQFEINVASQRLDEVNARIQQLKQERATLQVGADDSRIKEVESEIAQLEQESVNIQLTIDNAQLQQTKSEIESLDDEEIEIQLRNQSAMEAIDQIGQGFDRLKQGASEVGEQMSEILASAGSQETNKAFLEHAIGAEAAAQATEDINKAVQKLPGDDTVMQGLLSQAKAKDASLTADALNDMGTAAADYFSAMAYYGKPATEAFQDMNNYLLAGNTAEIERSPILANHIDKLKEGTTLQERSKLLQEALNEEHWGGMSQQDTYNNKLETFNGMLERGKYNLGGMFQEAAKGGMDFIMQLDDMSGGLVGMGIALAGFASPITDTVMGLGQMATGIKAIKDLGFISTLTEWLPGFTAVKDALMGLIPAQYAEGTAGWFSIGWIAVAILLGIALGLALIYLYNNCEWFREAVDNLADTLQWVASVISGAVMSAVQWLMDLFNNFTNQLGLNTSNWIEAILGFLLFIPQLPLQVGIALTNAIAHALGFGNNFVQRLTTAGVNAVNGFINYIRQIPTMVYQEFQRTLQLVNDFINSIPQRVWDMGVAIIDALKSALGIGSPGHMFYMVEGEFNRIDDLTKKTSFDTGSIGQSMVDSFNPNLQTSNQGISQGPGGNTITINIDSVDNEERIQQIVDAVEQALAWDNVTAGRTV